MNPVYRFFHSLAILLARSFYGYRVHGKENIRIPGAALLVSNHISFLDPIMIGIAFREPIYYLARKSLYRRRFAAWLFPRLNCVPVDQGRADVTSLKTIIRLLEEGKKVVIFPEGTRSLDSQLQEFAPGVGLIIAKSKAPVLPCRVFGADKGLPPKAKLPQSAEVSVTFGPVWRYKPEDFPQGGKEAYGQIANHLHRLVSELKPF